MAETENNIIAAELKRIQDEQGRLTPEIVVAVAEEPDNPLHDLFEWDDALAGHKHRIAQAREVIRSVKLTVTYKTKTICVPAYVRDPGVGSSEQGYVTISVLASEKDLARAALKNELSQAKAALVRAENISEYLNIRNHVTAIREIVANAAEQIDRLIDDLE